MEAAPRDISLDAIREHLLCLDGVMDVHEMHLWSITSTQHAFSCHLLLEHGRDPHQVVKEATALLRERFGIRHSTMQTESLLVHGEEHQRHPLYGEHKAERHKMRQQMPAKSPTDVTVTPGHVVEEHADRAFERRGGEQPS